VGSRTAQWL